MMITRARLEALASRWRRLTIIRDAFYAAAAVTALTAVTLIWPMVPLPESCIAVLAVLGVRVARRGMWRLDAATIATHLDRSHPALEESSALWLRSPESLTLLERLQLKRLNAAVPKDAPDRPFGAPPRGFLTVAGYCLLASVLMLAIAVAATARRARHPEETGQAIGGPAHATTPAPQASKPVFPKIVGSEMFIVPPAYTARPPRRVDGLNSEVEQGSAVTWQITLDRPVREARLVFGDSGADAVLLHGNPAPGDHIEGARTVNDSGLYHLAATLPDGTEWSPPELFSIKIIRDLPPVIRIVQPALPRTVLDSPAIPLTIEALGSDDYGLVDAHLVATVAKGAGESVKFREQTIAFDINEAATSGPGIPAGARRLVKTLDLAGLGLEAGDELYFYVEATDNRQPAPNRSRSETRFISIRGPDETPQAGGLGVGGVNLVPQYFRSERQLIIDTEKLIADQAALPLAEVRRRSNDLGVDQGLLRLRYGQFVGEEFEQSAVSDHTEVQLNPLQAAPATRTGPHAAASVAMRFQQEHTAQDRDGVTADNETGPRSPVDHPLSADQVRAPYVDQHDSQDKATLFDQETKGTLRDAIGDMWQAEGFLRTTRPQDALAPEHHALEILKDLQQSARSYVQHVGFDPPPLKVAERRLQGDVSKVPPRASVPEETAADTGAASLENVRAALAAIPWDQAPTTLDAGRLDALRRIEPALTAAANAHPDQFIDGLRALRRVLAGGSVSREDFGALEHALFHLLPATGQLPERPNQAAPSLGPSYFQALSQPTSANRAP